MPFSEDAVVELPFKEETMSWQLPDNNSLWFVYPKAGPGKQFRPVAHRLDGPPKPVILDGTPELHKFALLPEKFRLEKIAGVLKDMATNFSHPDWNRLDALYLATEHFRFNAQNAFAVLSDHPKSLVASVFNLRESTIERLSSEYAIPWFRYPVSFWIDSFGRYKERLVNINLLATLLKPALQSKLDWIGKHLGLTSIKCILEEEMKMGEPIPNLRVELLKDLIAQGFHGAENKPGLRGRHLDKWPEQVCTPIARAYSSLPQPAINLLPGDIQPYQKPFVYLPFVMASATVFPDIVMLPELTPLDKFRLQEMISFDPEWFYMAYDFAQGYLWKNKSN
jgi:hypothetical protein